MKKTSAGHPFRARLSWVLLVLTILLAGAYVLRLGDTPASPDKPIESASLSQAATHSAEVDAPSAEETPAQQEFREWLADWSAPVNDAQQARQQEVAAGLALARARRPHMERLIRENPEQAIAESLTLEEWGALPVEIQAVVERPFSVTADYDFFPVCPAPGSVAPEGAPEYIAELHLADGTSLETFVYGVRRDVMSKRQLPTQGITLGGLAAMREGALQMLSPADVRVARELFDTDQADSGLSFATGNAVGAGAVHALAGGKLFVFASEAEVDMVNDRLAAADARPGPVAASSLIALPYGEGEIDWSTVELFAEEQASAWTETEKNVFLIRVNFTDNAADPVSKADAEATMNGIVTETIEAMSYQKTSIDATVSTNLYTMPQTAAYYNNVGSGLNTELLRDARNTFRNNKSGDDAAIDIGPESLTGNGDSGGLGDYDIVGVTFVSIGMSGGGVTYAGLAGGSNLWMQGNNSAGVYIHEFGHNYGIGHASSWDTSDGSIVGTGTSTEYGDIYDIMGSGDEPTGHFHAQAKAKLDWLTSAQWADATAQGSGSYRVYQIDDGATTGTLRGVRVTKVASPAEYYWVNFRPAIPDNPNLTSGAYLNWQRSGQTRCWLLDTTPDSTDGKSDAGLVVGRTYADVTADTYITPLATGGSGADKYLDVQINLGPFPGNQSPIATAITGPDTVTARTDAAYSVSASDGDSDTLAYWWDGGDGNVGSNADAITRQWVVGGTYTLKVTVSDMKGGVGVATKTVTVTDPIDNWTQHSMGNTASQRAAVWGKARFVAADYWGGMTMSYDGINWTSSGDAPAFDQQPVLAFGNDVFVVGGKKDGVAEAQLCYSTDGRFWSAASFPAGIPQVRGIAFGDGKFLALADDGNVLTSTDGITWTASIAGAAPDFRHVVWDGNTWLAIAENDAGSQTEAVWTSLDGTSWSPQTELGFDAYALFAQNGVAYAIGWYGGIQRSTDHGLSWTPTYIPGDSRWSTFNMAAADDGTLLVLARAMDEAGSPYALLVSNNGTQWTRSTANSGNTLVADDGETLAFGAGRFLTLENGGMVRVCDPFYPSNSAPTPAFTAHPATLAARQSALYAAVSGDADGDPLTYIWDFGSQIGLEDGASTVRTFDFGGSYTVTLHVSDGRGGLTTITQAVTVTDPASTFTLRTSNTTKDLFDIAANTNLAVAVGGNGGVILTSPDGVTWTPQTVASSGNIYFRGATWDGSKFIVVGQDYRWETINGWVGVIYTSPDGTTWTRRYLGDTVSTELQAVASDGTGAVAVGRSGTVLSSADGLSWSPVAVSGLDFNDKVEGVAWSGSTYVLTSYVSTNGTCKVFTSTDRTNWIDRSSGAGLASWQDLRKIAWLNDRFVASGWYSKLRASTDQGETFTTTRTDSERTPGLAYGDGIYFAAGTNISDSEADVDLLSLDGNSWMSLPAPTSDDRNAAIFFKHTFITVGDGGSIWQSGDTTPVSTSNQAPTFAGYAVATPYQTAVDISIAALLSEAEDLDGDTLYVTEAGTSAQGAGTGLLANTIHYDPPTGFSGTDTFPIIISDEWGASVSGVATVSVLPDGGIVITTVPTLVLLPDTGSGVDAQISFNGIPGVTYQIKRSGDLSNWFLIETITAPVNGVIDYTDPDPLPGKGFYRLVIP